MLSAVGGSEYRPAVADRGPHVRVSKAHIVEPFGRTAVLAYPSRAAIRGPEYCPALPNGRGRVGIREVNGGELILSRISPVPLVNPDRSAVGSPENPAVIFDSYAGIRVREADVDERFARGTDLSFPGRAAVDGPEDCSVVADDGTGVRIRK